MNIFANVNFLSAFLLMAGCVSAGFIMRRRNVIGEGGAPALTAIIYKLSVPCLTYLSFMQDFSAEDIKNGANVLVSAFVFYAVAAVIGFTVFKRRGKQTATVSGLLCAVGQLTLFTIPLLRALGSDKAVLYCSMMTLPFRITVYCVGFSLICLGSGKGRFKKLFLNPIMISMLLGFAVWVLQDSVPFVSYLRIDRTLPAVYRAAGTVSDLLCPLAMLLVGLNLGEEDISSTVKDRYAWLTALIRTALVPLCVMGICLILSFDREAVTALTLGFSAPCSVTIAAFCTQAKHDTAYSAHCVALSTIMCVVTIPLINALLAIV